MEFRLIKVELTVKVCGYQSTGRSAMCEHYTIKVELIFKLCGYQSTGRSTMCENYTIKVELVFKFCGYQNAGRSAMCKNYTTKRKSVEIKNNSEKSSGWKKEIIFHLFLVLRAV